MPFPKDKLVATEYQPFDQGQPPVHFGERTGIQSVITSPWVLRWASIPATYATYREIRKLGTLAMARELKVAPVLASDWTIDADDGVPDEWKTLIEKTFFPLRDEFMAPTLYYGDVDFGYMAFEKVIEPVDGYLKIVRFKPLLHDITELCIGHKGGFIGVRQLGKDLGLANSVHIGFRVEGSYLYGVPLLENARQAYNWWIDCNEGARRYDRKIAGAHIIVEYPVGTSTDRSGKEVENSVLARTVLDSLEAAGGVAIPRDMAAFMQQLDLESPGWKIWILDAGSNQQGTFVERLEYLDKQLCRCLHIPERAMMEGTHGTKAEAEAHADVIFTIQDIEHRRVTAELNRQGVDQVLLLNFGKQAVGKVRLKASPIVDEKKEFFKEIYANLLRSPAGQRELESLDAASLREQLGLPQVQDDPGDIEHADANLQAVPGLSAGIPGGAGKQFLARDRDGRPVTVAGDTENPAAALANAVWGMRDAIALSSTALKKAEAAELRAEIVRAAAETDTAPSDSQKKSGNYRKGQVTVQGLPISIENPIGSKRRGTTRDGTPWETTIKGGHYGYIRRAESGADGDQVDVFLGPDPTAETVYVVDQTKPPKFTTFDEHKCFVGFPSAYEAKQAYLANYQPGWRGFKAIVAMPMAEFKAWLKDGDTSRPASDVFPLALCNEGGEALELTATDPVEQEPWHEEDENLIGKNVPLGPHDRLHFTVYTYDRPDLDETDPEGTAIRREHDLGPTQNLQFKRHVGPKDTQGSYDITGQGKTGLVLSHAAQAIRELLSKRPMSLYFTASGKSRISAYSHLLRRLAKEGVGNGEYRFMVRNGREGPGDPIGSYHIIHQEAAHLRRYRNMQPVMVQHDAAFANDQVGEPLGLAGTEPVTQPAWEEHYTPAWESYGHPSSGDPANDWVDEDEEPLAKYGPDYKKSVPIGEGDTLHFTVTPTDNKTSLVTKYGPEAESLRREHDLDYPHEFAFGRENLKGVPDRKLSWLNRRYTVTGQGKAGLIMSHAVHALREFLGQRRPMAVYVTGEEPSRQKAYEHLARRATAQSGGEGEYRAFRDFMDPSQFHIVHRAVADSPGYAKAFPNMEEIGAREPLTASGATMDDVLAVRPIAGRLAENMNTVAMDNEAQRKSIAPAIDAPELVHQSVSPGMQILLDLRARRQAGGGPAQPEGYANLSPGAKILFELRARRGGAAGGYGFANDPPEAPEAPEGGNESKTSSQGDQKYNVFTTASPERFREEMRKAPPPKGVSIKPEHAGDFMSLLDVLDQKGGRATTRDFIKHRSQSHWTGKPRDPASSESNHLRDTLGKMVQEGVLKRENVLSHGVPLDVELRTKAYDLKKQGMGYRRASKQVGLNTNTVKTWFKNEPDWTPETAPKGREGAAFTHAHTSANAYLRTLRDSMQRNLKTPWNERKAPKSGSPNEPVPKTAKGKILQQDRHFIGNLSKALDEATQARGIKLPDGHEWQDLIFKAAMQGSHNPDSVGVPASDRQDIISRIGVAMLGTAGRPGKLDEYNRRKQGPFVPWFTKEINEAGKTAVEEFRREKRGQIPGNVSIDAPVSRGKTLGETTADTKEPVPGEGIYQPTERRLVDRSRAMSMLDRKWPEPITRAALRVVERDVGPTGAALLQTMALNPDQQKVFDLFNPGQVGEAAAAARYKQTAEKVLQSLRDHLGTGDDEDQRLLDLFEVSLHTKRTRDNPVYMSNAKRKAQEPEEHPERLLFD